MDRSLRTEPTIRTVPISTAPKSSPPREAITVTESGRPAVAWRRGAPWLAAGLVLLLVAATAGARGVPYLTVAPSVGYAHPAAAPPKLTVNLTMTDAPSFSPRSIIAAPGQNVSIHLNNTGHLPHSFTLSSASGPPLNRSWTPSELNASFVAHPPTVNITVPPGSHAAWANLTIPLGDSFDSFEYVSQVPYQFQAGMWGFLNISSDTPPLVLSENTTNSLSFQPAALAASPTHFPANVQVDLTNLGTLGHTFTLAAESNVTIPTIGYFKDHPPLANVTIPASAGGTAVASFTIPAAGVYEYVCTVPGHFTSGMFGFLYAGVPVPAASAPPSTAIVETWVLAGSAVLLGIGVMIAIVGSFTGRFPRSPSPPHHGGH